MADKVPYPGRYEDGLEVNHDDQGLQTTVDRAGPSKVNPESRTTTVVEPSSFPASESPPNGGRGSRNVVPYGLHPWMFAFLIALVTAIVVGGAVGGGVGAAVSSHKSCSARYVSLMIEDSVIGQLICFQQLGFQQPQSVSQQFIFSQQQSRRFDLFQRDYGPYHHRGDQLDRLCAVTAAKRVQPCRELLQHHLHDRISDSTTAVRHLLWSGHVQQHRGRTGRRGCGLDGHHRLLGRGVHGGLFLVQQNLQHLGCQVHLPRHFFLHSHVFVGDNRRCELLAEECYGSVAGDVQ